MKKLFQSFVQLGCAVFIVAGVLFTLPHYVLAAGTCDPGNSNPDCLSFDPAVNPMLTGYKSNTAQYAGDAAVGGGQCIDYIKGPLGVLGKETGCLSPDGKTFGVYNTTTDVSISVYTGGAVAPTTVVTGVDSQGAKSVTVDNPTATAVANGIPDGCSFVGGNLGTCLVSILAKIIASITFFILMATSAILALANYVLNWSAYITVFQFGKLVGNSAGVLAAWGVMRDVGNIVLLFGFIFLGVSTILNLPHSEYTAKRALPALLIFALLLNFSLLAAEAVIDTSNAVATSIYTQSGGGVCENSSSFIECSIQQGIGGKIMQASGITGVFSSVVDPTKSPFAGSPPTTQAIIMIGLTLFTIITAFVLFAAAIMLIIRAVILGLLMVTAPIGFAGMAIPPLHEIAQRWWSQLLSQAFFAPIYFLLVMVSLKVMEGVTGALGTTGQSSNQTLAAVFSTSATGGGSSNISIGISFALLIGFMIAALMFAKNSSAIGTGYAIKSAGGLSLGTLGFVGRRTVGRGSMEVANRIAASKFGRTGVGRLAFGIANTGATASFDGRTGGAGKALGGAVGNMGAPSKAASHGIHGIEEEGIKKRVDYAKNIRQTSDEEATVKRIDKEQKDLSTERNEKTAQLNAAKSAFGERKKKTEFESNMREFALNTQKTALDTATAGGDPAKIAAEKKKYDDLVSAHEAQTKTEKADLDTAERNLELRQRTHDEEMGVLNEKIKRNAVEKSGGTYYAPDGSSEHFESVSLDAAKKEYGKNIEHDGLPFSLEKHMSHRASADIIRNAGKSKTERALDDLKGSIKSDDDHTTPAPAPAGGGDAPTAH